MTEADFVGFLKVTVAILTFISVIMLVLLVYDKIMNSIAQRVADKKPDPEVKLEEYVFIVDGGHITQLRGNAAGIALNEYEKNPNITAKELNQALASCRMTDFYEIPTKGD